MPQYVMPSPAAGAVFESGDVEMNASLLFALVFAQSPVQVGMSVGGGVDHALYGAQLEAGAGPISVGAAVAPTQNGLTLPIAASLRVHLPDGLYLYGAAATRSYAPVPLNYQDENSFADRWHHFSAGVGLRVGLGLGLFATTSLGFPVTCGREWPWPFRSQWSWQCNVGATLPAPDVPAAPDFGFALGWAVGGERLAVAPSALSPLLAAGFAGVGIDGLSLGLISARWNYGHRGDAAANFVPTIPTLIGLFVLHPFVVAAAACWSRHDFSLGAMLRAFVPALAADLLGGGLLFGSLFLGGTRSNALAFTAVAARSLITPWAATAWPPPDRKASPLGDYPTPK